MEVIAGLTDAPLYPMVIQTQVTDTYVYEAFGTLIGSTSSTVNNYLYTGEQFDANSGFYYLRARYYDQTNGRFVTRNQHWGSTFDPVTLHKYLYTGANPVNRTMTCQTCIPLT